MKGYKVFNPDWTCRGYQFEVGKTFEEDVKPECCLRGFHFCAKTSDCFNYYRFDPQNKVAEVEAVGDIDTNSDNTKCSTNKLHIIREITWQEVLELVNSGKACTGLCNSGDRNSGDRNSGNRNSGDYNSGNYNSGDCNSGDCNRGNRNSGDYNSGNYNRGNCNSGYYNNGDYNSGNCNSGDYNSGNYNSGDWNKTSNAVGCFNTEPQKLKFFNKETDMTFEQWINSEARYLLSRIDFRPVDWILPDDMSDEEKAEHPEHEATGGYLKIRSNTDCCVERRDGLSERDRNIIRNMPNFDRDIFKEITGIDVEG